MVVFAFYVVSKTFKTFKKALNFLSQLTPLPVPACTGQEAEYDIAEQQEKRDTKKFIVNLIATTGRQFSSLYWVVFNFCRLQLNKRNQQHIEPHA